MGGRGEGGMGEGEGGEPGNEAIKNLVRTKKEEGCDGWA